MKSFDVLSRDLKCRASYVLEASAGTGKTFSIENIVCRLIIENDPPYLLDQILVVTFTKAATADLKKRIRQNLEKTLKILKNPENFDFKPDYIQAILEKEEPPLFAINRLKNALFTFDQAQIFTIHSFCARMLQDYVLEGGISINGMQNESSILKRDLLDVVRNFFRTELTAENFSKAQLNIVLKKHKSDMESLERALLKWATSGPVPTFQKSFNELFDQFVEVMSTYSYQKDKIIADFEAQIVNYRKLKNHETGHEKIERFASLFEKKSWSMDDFDGLIEDGLYFLEALDEKLLKVKTKPVKDLENPNFIPVLKKTLLPLVNEASTYEIIFSRMVYLCRKLVDHYLKEEEKFCFDDLLKLMKEALNNPCFCLKVQQRYKSAIIDEFQDTDPIQWEIFNQLFTGICPLYLVGDPKQSIYAFRQADIYTYLKAAKTIPEDHRRSLDTNFRSTPSLTSALNALFEKSINPDFIELPKLQTTLEFRKVNASDKIQDYPFKDSLGSIHFFTAEVEAKKAKFPIESFEACFFPFMAEQIELLRTQGVKLSQIAILVKDQFQAKRLLSYFKDKNIDLSLQRLSDLSESPILSNLIELLAAVISPRDESALKTALGGPFFGLTHSDILQFKNSLPEEILFKFYEFKKILYNFGFSSFFQAFLKSLWNEMSVAENLMSCVNGINAYEDLLQISDILSQHTHETNATPEQLLNFLKEFDLLSFNSDDRIKKLKDPNLEAVRVLTIHSSKGLEFDIVFALGLVNRTPSPEIFIPAYIGDESILEPLVDKTSENYIHHCNELDAEKLRQLYVAMTRAKYRLYVPVAFCLKTEEIEPPCASCMELFLAKINYFKKEGTSLYDTIRQLNSADFTSFIETLKAHVNISYSKLTERIFSSHTKNRENIVINPPPVIEIAKDSTFMTSFTHLAAAPFGFKKNPINRDLTLFKAKQVVPHDFFALQKTIHTLPTGVKTGNLLHKVLESFYFEKYASINNSQELESYVDPFLAGTKFQSWGPVFCDILFNVLNCRLLQFKLKEIDPSKIYREQEFIYPYTETKGYMKGVIDLMFLHDGKYYFIDWKSNWLGVSHEAYTEEALRGAMSENEYYLQADIYKEAIRRFLKLVDARPFEECFGGIFYIFLRGLSPVAPHLGLLHFI